MAFDRDTKSAIRKMIRLLPGELQSRHGGTGHGGYSVGQVESSVRRLDLPVQHLPYALALFCFESEFRNALSDEPELLQVVLENLKHAANSGFIDVTGWSVGSWLTDVIVDNLAGEGVGEIGAEGGDF